MFLLVIKDMDLMLPVCPTTSAAELQKYPDILKLLHRIREMRLGMLYFVILDVHWMFKLFSNKMLFRMGQTLLYTLSCQQALLCWFWSNQTKLFTNIVRLLDFY